MAHLVHKPLHALNAAFEVFNIAIMTCEFSSLRLAIADTEMAKSSEKGMS